MMEDALIRTSDSVADTEAIGAELADQLQSGDVVALYGNLGAGKTCLIRGLAQALKSADPVTSPTFTLINEYQATPPIYHFDLYRLKHAGELEDIGYEDYFYGKGVSLVEWPDKAEMLLPKLHWKIRIEIEPGDLRRIVIQKPLRGS